MRFWSIKRKFCFLPVSFKICGLEPIGKRDDYSNLFPEPVDRAKSAVGDAFAII